jgi:hypothetical protein
MSVLAPLAGVMIGFFLSLAQSWRKDRKRREAVIGLLFMELRRNYRTLVVALLKPEERVIQDPPDVYEALAGSFPYHDRVVRTDKGALPPPQLVARACERFSSLIYRTFIGDIYRMKLEDAERVYAAYYAMEDCQKDSGPMTEVPLPRQKHKRTYVGHAGSLLTMSERVLGDISRALDVFECGKRALAELSAERGSDVDKLEEAIREMERRSGST